MEEACEQGDGIECAESGAEEEASATRDCGDGPFVCESGYVFFREDSQTRITADPTDTARPQAAYIVYNATVPGTETPTGTTYGTVEPGIGSQGQLYLVRTLNGIDWSTPTRITPAQGKGHQFFPDVDANAGRLHVVWQDSRSDTATGPPSTPSGGDFRTVPISNQWVPANPPGSRSAGVGVGVETFYAVSTNQGAQLHRSRSCLGTVADAAVRAVRQPRHPVLRRLQLDLRGRRHGPDGLDRPARPDRDEAGNGSALHERRRHGRLRRPPVPGAGRTRRSRRTAARMRAVSTRTSSASSARPRRRLRERRRAGASRPFVVKLKPGGFLTSSRPCRPCRACRRRRPPSRGPRPRSPRS